MPDWQQRTAEACRSQAASVTALSAHQPASADFKCPHMASSAFKAWFFLMDAATACPLCALQVAHMGVTTTAVIHQPSYDVFRMFDDILLLCKGGRTAFYGREAEVGVLQCHAGKMHRL